MFKEPLNPRRRLLWALIGVILVELCLIGGALSLKPALQAIPGRYRVRLPEFVQRLAAEPHPDTLPTPVLAATFALPTFPVTPPTPTETLAPPTRTPLARPPTQEGQEPLATPTATLTVEPTPTFTPHFVPGPAQAARSTPADLERAAVLLAGFTHAYQLWNNCGPATLTMALSYYGWGGDQRQAAAFLKPDQEDKNVNPSEMVEFIQQQNLEAVLRYGGDVNLIRELLLAGFPVLVEKGFDPEPERLGWMGHYLLVVGYNEFDGAFITMDSYLGPSQNEPYPDFDDFWKHFNRTYVVIYRPEERDDLAAVLGDNMDPTVNFWNALSIAIDEVNENPQDAFAWFNLGTSYAQVAYYQDAAGSYDQARLLGLPWRMLWYQFGPYQAYFQVGRYDEVLALAEAALATTVEVEETFYYKGLALQAQGDMAGARDAYQQAVNFNPNYVDAIQALAALPAEG
jgi:tetratricopeptide (TPR) repeat protein